MKKLSVFWLMWIISSCSEIDCERYARRFRQKECNMIVQETPGNGRRFKLVGVNPSKKARETYLDQDAWYLHFNHRIDKGDTVMKKQGEITMAIHKKDTVLVYHYSCEGKAY